MKDLTRQWQILLWWSLPAFVCLLLTILRWQRFGDVQVDFGQDIAAAWSLTEGAHLYTDIAYFKGPFSPHWNALLMTLFGVSIRTIVIANILTALWIAYGIVLLGRRACGIGKASILGCAFLLVFAFAVERHYTIFNFITPFVHELPHGIALSFACVLLLERWARTKEHFCFILAGFFFGLTLLTRIEVAFSLTGAILAWAWCMRMQGASLKSLLKGSVLFTGTALIVVAVIVAMLSRWMPLPEALASTFASYVAATTTNVVGSPFFLMISGWDAPLRNIAWSLAMLLTVSVWMLLLYACADLWRMKAKDMSIVMGIAALIILLMLCQRLLPFVHGGLLTFTAPAILCYAAWQVFRKKSGDKEALRLTFVTSVFALLMLLKIFLSPSIRFYGFAHGMPAYMLMYAVLITVIEPLGRKRLGGQGARIFGVLMLCAVLLDAGAKARIDQYLIAEKIIPIASGADHFRVADVNSNRYYREFLEAAPALIPPGSTLTAIPEGAMINYLLRLPLGIPVLNMMRTEYYIFGKDRIEGDLFARRPDFILITHKDTSVFGLPLYGKMPEYGADVMAWLTREYAQIALFGEQPLTHPESEGVALWRRKDFRLPQNPQDVPSLR